MPTTAGMPRLRRPFEHGVAVLPGVLAARRLDLVPVQVEADDVDAELLEPVEPLVERAGAVDEPGVVLDPEADARARRQRAGAASAEQRARQQSGGERRVAFEGGFPAPALPTHQDPVNERGGGALRALHERHVAHGREPDVDARRRARRRRASGSAARASCVRSYAAGYVSHDGAARHRPPARGDRGALRRPLAGAALRRAAARLPAGGRLLRHRRPARSSSWSSSCAGVDPDVDRDRGRRARADDLGRPRRGRASPGQVYQQAEIEYGRFERRIPLEQRRRRRRGDARPTRPGMLRITLPIAQRARAAGRRDRRRAGPDERDRRPERLRLPVLPLKETVVFPESMTPLAVGQERSIKLIDDVVSGERMLALFTVRERGGRPAGLGRPLPRRHGRGRPQDDQGPRRDAAHPRPGRSSASGSSSRRRTSRTSSASSRSCRTSSPTRPRSRR